jgi:hypothetical protein
VRTRRLQNSVKRQSRVKRNQIAPANVHQDVFVANGPGPRIRGRTVAARAARKQMRQFCAVCINQKEHHEIEFLCVTLRSAPTSPDTDAGNAGGVGVIVMAGEGVGVTVGVADAARPGATVGWLGVLPHAASNNTPSTNPSTFCNVKVSPTA